MTAGTEDPTGTGQRLLSSPTTRQPSLSIPCFAERRYGGVLDDEMLMALPPEHVNKAIDGMTALAKNGFRYPAIRHPAGCSRGHGQELPRPQSGKEVG